MPIALLQVPVVEPPLPPSTVIMSASFNPVHEGALVARGLCVATRSAVCRVGRRLTYDCPLPTAPVEAGHLRGAAAAAAAVGAHVGKDVSVLCELSVANADKPTLSAEVRQARTPHTL